MEDRPVFCQHSGAPEACRQSLIDAWREGSIGTHCIMEGLRVNWHECRQILSKGLYDGSKPRRSRSNNASGTGGTGDDLEGACKQVVLEGYPLQIKALQETFYEAYYRLVHTVIHRRGLTENTVPSASDVCQAALLSLHKYLRNGLSIKWPLRKYVAKVALYEYFKRMKREARYLHLQLQEDNKVQVEGPRSAAILPPVTVENWESLDHRLLNSDQGNLINRIILAQQCVEGCSTADRPSAKDLKAAWQALSCMSKRDVASLHQKAVSQMKDSSVVSAAHMAAELINACLAEPCQVAIIFAAGAGMDVEQTRGLIDQLCNLSESAIYARIYRIYRVLRPSLKRKRKRNEERVH